MSFSFRVFSYLDSDATDARLHRTACHVAIARQSKRQVLPDRGHDLNSVSAGKGVLSMRRPPPVRQCHLDISPSPVILFENRTVMHDLQFELTEFRFRLSLTSHGGRE